MGKDAPRPLAEPEGLPRRLSSKPLPPYRHVPGLTPHPVKDPQGHLFGQVEDQPSSPCRELPERWFECEEYLYGVDLFNRAYLWEAHEAWEIVWIAGGKSTEPATFVQGLIQVSAALLRAHLGTPRGAQNLLARAWGNLDRVTVPISYMGLAIEPWRLAVEQYLRDAGSPFPFLLLEI